MKSKNMPQTITRRLRKYIPLLMALGIVGAWIWLIMYASRFPNPHDGAVLFYPFVHTASNFNLLAASCALVMSLHGVAIMLNASKILTGLSFLVMIAIMIFWSFLGWLEAARLKDYDARVMNGHLYRLVYISNGEIWGYSSPIEAYSVLECEDSGLWCHYYSTPYLKERFTGNDFPKEARLEIDPVSQRLMLHVAQDIIDVAATDVFKICRQLYQHHTDRNRNIDYQGYVCN